MSIRPVRIDAFESLRGLMALWVVVGHVALTFDIPALEASLPWRVVEQNGRAVDVFIILSGFVIFRLIATKREPYGCYIARRFLRLFPAYLLCLVVASATLSPSHDALSGLAGASSRNSARLQLFADAMENFQAHFLAHLTMLHGLVPGRWLPSSDYAILGQAWSISVEWQFYLLAPLAFALLTARRRWLGLLGIGALVLALFAVRHFAGLYGEGFVGNHLLHFAIGCLSALAWQAGGPWRAAVARHSAPAILLAVAAWLAIQPGHWEVAIWLAVVLSCLAEREAGGRRRLAGTVVAFLSTPVLRRLGRISYSFYLTHMIVLYAALWTLRGAGLSQPAEMAAVLAMTLAGTFAASTLMYRWVEAPFIDLGRRLFRPAALAGMDIPLPAAAQPHPSPLLSPD